MIIVKEEGIKKMTLPAPGPAATVKCYNATNEFITINKKREKKKTKYSDVCKI